MPDAPQEPRLREAEIRPDHLMKGQAERFAADINRLLERRADFVAVPCPGCGVHESRSSFNKYELDYRLCARCGTLFVSPRPTPAILEAYYRNSENYAYWNRYIFPASEDARREKIFRPRVHRTLEFCDRYRVRRGTLLEIGAGFGTFCQEISLTSAFDRVIAVEPTPDLAQTCRARNIEVIEKPIERISSDECAADVIASFEVIEHLFSPQEFVRQCRTVLNPGGLLILTCPNFRGFDIQVLRAESDAVDVEHLNYFHPDSIRLLLEGCKFEVLEISTPGQLDAEIVRKKVIEGKASLAGQPFLEEILMRRWDELGGPFQRFLAEHRLSSHMWTVARLTSG